MTDHDDLQTAYEHVYFSKMKDNVRPGYVCSHDRRTIGWVSFYYLEDEYRFTPTRETDFPLPCLEDIVDFMKQLTALTQ